MHDQLSRPDEATPRFVANVSHEPKTPVAAMGYCRGAAEPTDDPRPWHFAGKLLTESQRPPIWSVSSSNCPGCRGGAVAGPGVGRCRHRGAGSHLPAQGDGGQRRHRRQHRRAQRIPGAGDGAAATAVANLISPMRSPILQRVHGSISRRRRARRSRSPSPTAAVSALPWPTSSGSSSGSSASIRPVRGHRRDGFGPGDRQTCTPTTTGTSGCGAGLELGRSIPGNEEVE